VTRHTPQSSYRQRLVRAPAVRALLIQCGAAPLSLGLVYLLATFHFPVDYLTVAVLHGLVAAAITWAAGLAVWWRAIEFVFPLAVLAALSLRLPPWLFLAVFLVLLGLYWSTFRTQVPYYPSGKTAWAAVAGQLPQDRPIAFIDIGSGLGGLVLDLARRRPDAQATGIELAPLPWLASYLRARMQGSRARFIRGDYETLDFGQYDAVFAYLSPAAMTALWRKARREMRPGSMLMSYEFAIQEAPPGDALFLQDTGRTLYIWHF
jgi:hypothetical protein